ncbi:MAG: Lipoprotein NlpI precursor [Verrucomicrobiota bacterium]
MHQRTLPRPAAIVPALAALLAPLLSPVAPAQTATPNAKTSANTVAATEPETAAIAARLERLTQALQQTPDRIPLLSERGDCHLFLGHFKESVADFEAMIALDPRLDAGHWRLGIAYHFNRQFEASSRQFAKYHAYDGRDRENGLWKFLADANLAGIAAARQRMLEYMAFDREPFPLLYDLFAGRTNPEAFFADLEVRGVLKRPLAAFFAHYYCGLWEALSGRPDAAREHLSRAVSMFPADTDGGPGYMGRVARLHLAEGRSGFPTLRPGTGPTSSIP